VQIGLSPGIPQAWLRRALRIIRDDVPSAAITFIDASSAEQLKMIGRGSIDIGLVYQHPPTTLQQFLLFEQPFGVAIRPDHELAGQPVFPLRNLEGLRVLMHARDQIPAEHDRMLTVANELGINPNWRFAGFTENALLCAEATDADAVLLSEPSATRMLPEWPWSEVVEPTVRLRTWAVRQDRTRAVVKAAMDALSRAQQHTDAT
jgi:DNA-binding transcriptional LysR family regulator